ncbi:MAG: DUF1302 domain-containing protein [Nitrincola sp.]|nr:DUF1302 domain-containing protein [Nitrincola sp.]
MATQHSYFTRNTPKARPKFTPVLLTSLLAAGFTAQVQAVEFQLGEIQGRFQSNISIGTSIRMENPDSSLISRPNSGTSAGSGSYDDGTQNFKKGKPFSTVVKGVHDLELTYENVGFFGRGKYWYDYELERGSRPHGHIPNGYVPNTRLNDSGFNDFAKFSGIELLDAYFYGGFDLGNMPLDIRVGRQVINWGESTFIQGGINAFNPVDVTAFRRPGAELKEGLLPFGSVFASLGLTDNLTVEGFYQYEWEPTVIDGCGTYFSTNDFAAQGCNGVRVDADLGFVNLRDISDQQYFNAPLLSPFIVERNQNGRRTPGDDNQFGIGFRYFSEALNNTEFGLFYAQYHSRLPLTSGVVGLAPGIGPFASTYFISYPEEIRMTGFSFSTNLGDIAWSGEISYKQDLPIQINGPLLVGTILARGQGAPVGLNPAADKLFDNRAANGEIKGYGLFDVTQAQTTFIKFYDNVLGASRLTTIAELGWTHIHGFDEGASALKYGRGGMFGFTRDSNTEGGFVTKNSYGYVLRGALEYPNAFAGVTLIPELNFRHGVKGNGPEPGAAFRENEKSVNIGLTADYMNRYRFGASYTTFFGGSFNAEKDRDYISLNASIAF